MGFAKKYAVVLLSVSVFPFVYQTSHLHKEERKMPILPGASSDFWSKDRPSSESECGSGKEFLRSFGESGQYSCNVL